MFLPSESLSMLEPAEPGVPSLPRIFPTHTSVWKTIVHQSITSEIQREVLYKNSVFRIRIQSGKWIRIRNPYPVPDSESGPGSRRAKITHKNIKKIQKFQVTWASFMEN